MPHRRTYRHDGCFGSWRNRHSLGEVRMKSRISLILGALAVAATTLAAQTPVPVTFKLEGLAILTDPGATPQPIVSFGGNSYYSSPYSGAFELGTSGVYGSPFLVYCVDYNHESNFGDTYAAVVTGLNWD